MGRPVQRQHASVFIAPSMSIHNTIAWYDFACALTVCVTRRGAVVVDVPRAPARTHEVLGTHHLRHLNRRSQPAAS